MSYVPIVSRLDRLDVVGLSVAYAGRPVLVDVDFSVRRGEFVVITGPVGSGKTTLLRALLGLAWQADVTGTVRWNGDEVADRAAFFVPPNAAFLPQVPQLISDCVADNVGLGPVGRGALATGACAWRRSPTTSTSMPDGVDTLIGPRGLRLSGGQRQRLATARALVHSPELVVLDDLSSALDVETEVQLWTNLADAGMTVIAVSHRTVAFRRADQVLRLEAGRPRSAEPDRGEPPGSARPSTGAVVGGVGAAGAARVGTEPPRSVAGCVVEEVVAVDGRARAETLGSMVADLLGERHQDVGDDLLVERRRRRCPVDVEPGAVVRRERWCDVPLGEFTVDPRHHRVGVGRGECRQGVEHGAHLRLDSPEGCRRCSVRAREPVLVEEAAYISCVAAPRIGERIDEVDHRLEGEADLGVVSGCDVHDTSVTSRHRVRY